MPNNLATEEMTACPSCGELTFNVGDCFHCISVAPNVPDRASYVSGYSAGVMAPIDMLIFCPSCGKQHVDQPEPDICQGCGYPKSDHRCFGKGETESQALNIFDPNKCNGFTAWLNPPHKSHTCRTYDGGCGLIFRIADLPTNGVQFIKTYGKDDTWTAAKPEATNV